MASRSKSAPPPPPDLGETSIERLEELIRAIVAKQGGGKRATRYSPFAQLLRLHFDWFSAQHAKHGLTWDGWVAVLTSSGLRNIDGEPLTARALKGAFLREKRARTGKAVRPVVSPAVSPPSLSGLTPARAAPQLREHGPVTKLRRVGSPPDDNSEGL